VLENSNCPPLGSRTDPPSSSPRFGRTTTFVMSPFVAIRKCARIDFAEVKCVSNRAMLRLEVQRFEQIFILRVVASGSRKLFCANE
jgi:hypothetical protein